MMRSLLASLLLAGVLLVVPQAAAADCASAGPNDFDGDGRSDVAVGDPFAGGGAVSLLSAGKVVPVQSPPELEPGDSFGWSVAMAEINGDGCADLVVGAPHTDVDGVQDAGAAWILYGGATAEPLRLVAPEPQLDAHVGWSLAAQGDLVAIGAPHEDEAELANSGALYVTKALGELRRISQESPDVPGNGEVDDLFGWSLAFARGDRLVVGVPYENDDGAGRQIGTGKVDSGSMTVIYDVTDETLSGLKWELPDRAEGDRFGYAVAHVGDGVIAVSAPQANVVQLFDSALKPTEQVEGTGAFGYALAASDNGDLAIGAPFAGTDGTGAVQVVPVRDLQDSRTITLDGQPGARFGSSVTFDGNRLIAGAPDAGPYGMVGQAGQNADTPELAAPAKGTDFGAALS